MNRQYASPLVSVIVPIYNVEHYIARCVTSICAQRYSNIEIILVDDGTTDRSGNIIDELAENDQRIHVIHQENSGVSTARNHGLSIANGEYITFVDGDDYIEPDYVDYFLHMMKATTTDLAVGRNNYSFDVLDQVTQDNINIQSDTQTIEDIYLGTINVAVWNKMYKKQILDRYSIRFHPEIWYGEGMLFNIEYLQYVNDVVVGERRVYHQVYNPNSAMRRFNLNSNFCGIHSLEIQKSLWKKTNTRIEMAYEYHYRNFSESIICGLVSINAVEEHRDVYHRCKQNIRSNIFLPWKVDVPIGRKLRLTLFAIIPDVIARRRARKSLVAAKRQEQLLIHDKPY